MATDTVSEPDQVRGWKTSPQSRPGAQSCTVDSRTISRLRCSASSALISPPGCTNGSWGRPVEVTRRTVSSYCRSDSCRPGPAGAAVQAGVRGVGDVDVVQLGAGRSGRDRQVAPFLLQHRLDSAAVPGQEHVVAHEQQPGGVRRRTAAPGRQARARTRRVTSVITTRLFSTSRTTIRPLVLATSGSSTPASWVFVPVDPLATASPVSELADGASALEEESSIAPAEPRMVVQRRPPQPVGTDLVDGVVDVPRLQLRAAVERGQAGGGPGGWRARVDEDGCADQAAEDERGDAGHRRGPTSREIPCACDALRDQSVPVTTDERGWMIRRERGEALAR